MIAFLERSARLLLVFGVQVIAASLVWAAIKQSIDPALYGVPGGIALSWIGIKIGVYVLDVREAERRET
jgi:hypothetical protein